MGKPKVLITYTKFQLLTATVAGLAALFMFGASVYVMISTSSFLPGLYGVGMAWLLNKLPNWLYGPVIVIDPDE